MIKSPINFVTGWPLIFILLTFCQSRQETWHKMSENKLVVHTDTVPHFYPLQHPIYDIFETKLAHTIATNDLYDVICLFQLNEDDAVITRLTENLPSGISGGDVTPAPFFSDEWIAYGQTRGFTRYNLRTHEFHDQMICTKLEEVVKACRGLDPQKNIFVFAICNMEKDFDRRFYKTYDLSGEKPVKIASFEAGKVSCMAYGRNVAVRDTILFFHDAIKNEIVSLNLKLQPVDHPLTKAFAEHKHKILKLYKLIIHPKLNFAFVYGSIPWVLSWKDDGSELTPFPFVEKDKFVNDFFLSSDGKRLGWGSESTSSSSTEKPQFWVSRVDENIPVFIGPPQLLGSVFSADTDPKAVAWGENPYTLVVSVMDGLYWWHVQ
jgi:hypothetical protein